MVFLNNRKSKENNAKTALQAQKNQNHLNSVRQIPRLASLQDWGVIIVRDSEVMVKKPKI